MSSQLLRRGKQCLNVDIFTKETGLLSVLKVTLNNTLSVYLLYFKQCNASLLCIINGYQFNFLSKQLSVITCRKKWLILMKSHREVSYILPWDIVESNTACVTCVTVSFQHVIMVLAAFFTTIESQLFSELSVLVHPGASARATGRVWFFLRGLRDFIPSRSPVGLLLHARGGLCSSESGHLSNSVTFQGNVC